MEDIKYESGKGRVKEISNALRLTVFQIHNPQRQNTDGRGEEEGARGKLL